MTQREGTPAELLALAVAIILVWRDGLTGIDPADPELVTEALSELRENLGVAGGSIMVAADELGLRTEVEAVIAEEQARVNAMRACRGLEGRA